jgi:RNA polymerase sigma-70 factor (ECF subfamily)
MEGLVALLASDVVLHSDGGGKAVAAPNLIRGVDKVARGALGAFQKLLPKNLDIRLTQINGDPGIVSYLNRQAILRSHLRRRAKTASTRSTS